MYLYCICVDVWSLSYFVSPAAHRPPCVSVQICSNLGPLRQLSHLADDVGREARWSWSNPQLYRTIPTNGIQWFNPNPRLWCFNVQKSVEYQQLALRRQRSRRSVSRRVRGRGFGKGFGQGPQRAPQRVPPSFWHWEPYLLLHRHLVKFGSATARKICSSRSESLYFVSRSFYFLEIS